jgi:hypothetical protein
MSIDNIDKYGFCVMCHINLITKRVVDGKVIEMFLPIHGETIFLLDNGSQMKVCMCKPCQQENDLQNPAVHSNIMDAVQKGWQLETKLLVENKTWDKEHGDKYLETMSKRTIDCHCEHLAINALHNRIKELTNGHNIDS